MPLKILAIGVIAVCGWTLAATIQQYPFEHQTNLTIPEALENGERNFERSVEQPVAVATMSPDTLLMVTTMKNYDDDSSSQPLSRIEAEPHVNDKEPRRISNDFKIILLASIGLSAFVALVQLIASALLLASSASQIRKRARFWELTEIIVIQCLVMAFLLPMSYNQDKDTFRGITSFAKYMETQFSTLHEFTNEPNENIIIQFLFVGINLYSIVIILTSGIMLVLTLLSCFCLINCGHAVDSPSCSKDSRAYIFSSKS